MGDNSAVGIKYVLCYLTPLFIAHVLSPLKYNILWLVDTIVHMEMAYVLLVCSDII